MSTRTSNRKPKPRGRKMEQVELEEDLNQSSQSQSVINPPLKKQKLKPGKKPKALIIANIKNVNLDNVDEVSEGLSQPEGSDESDKNSKTKKSSTVVTGKKTDKYERAKRQADYTHEKDDDEYRDFRILVAGNAQAQSGDEMFDAAGK